MKPVPRMAKLADLDWYYSRQNGKLNRLASSRLTSSRPLLKNPHWCLISNLAVLINYDNEGTECSGKARNIYKIIKTFSGRFIPFTKYFHVFLQKSIIASILYCKESILKKTINTENNVLDGTIRRRETIKDLSYVSVAHKQ